ncbi:MAG: tRNA epoxyqueuosine(34) reductase QueG [Candidatus Acidiferrum sp.]
MLQANWIAQRASAVGFALCGVVRPDKFPELLRTNEWLSRGYAGEMDYLANPKRGNPRAAFDGVRSVIVCALNYNTEYPHSTERAGTNSSDCNGEARGWISRYAWGRDYHEVLREKLDALVTAMRAEFPEPFEARTYADTGPLNERVLAKYARLGWLGKNTLLINEDLGSFFFLGVILTTLDLQPERAELLPPPDRCGSCTRCIDACPTQALVEPYVMDARKCISYLTIELRGNIPEEFREQLGTHVFGCDICQDVCPWNRRAPITQSEDFQPRTFPAAPSERQEVSANSLLLPRLGWLADMSEDEFRESFRGSPLKRTKWRGLVRNACIAAGNAIVPRGTIAHTELKTILERLADSNEPVVAESARWALVRIERSAEERTV